MMDFKDEFMTEQELCDQLGLQTNTLRKWAVRRMGPARTKAGKRVLYRREAVREWLLANEKNPAAARG